MTGTGADRRVVGRVIGIDHGLKRVGVAVGDEETGLAFPREGLRAGDAAERIRRLAADEGTSRVVVGLPLNMDGSEGPQAAAARSFGARLAGLGLEVMFSDERLTTWEAEQRSGAADRPTPVNAIDSAAAAVILEQYFAEHRRPPEET